MNKNLIGIDIGGTKIRAVLFSGQAVKDFKEVKTPKTKKLFFDVILEIVNYLDKKSEKIGIAFAGLVNEKGKILQAPNLKFLEGENLFEPIRQKFKSEVLANNDVSCFLRAEKEIGAVKDYSNVIAVTIGSGVGSAIMIDGKILSGANQSAGEIGHVMFPDMLFGKQKNCISQWHELEDITSQKWFLLKSQGNEKINIKEIAADAKKGDRLARRVFNDFGINLAFLVSILVNILDPEIIVIGGGIVKVKNLFTNAFETHIQKFVFSDKVKKNLKIIFSDNDNSVAIGAALLFENYYEKQ